MASMWLRLQPPTSMPTRRAASFAHRPSFMGKLSVVRGAGRQAHIRARGRPDGHEEQGKKPATEPRHVPFGDRETMLFCRTKRGTSIGARHPRSKARIAGAFGV